MIYFTGFADEAADDIDGQIKATKALGWDHIEARNVSGTNITKIDDAEFDRVAGKLSDAGITINCFGSSVANWGKDVTSETDVLDSVNELKRAVPRMQRLGTKMIRGMSYALPTENEPDAPEFEQLVIRNLRELIRICEDNGLTYVHENCMCYGGLSSDHALRLIEAINSTAFKLVYDTGNPVFSWDYRGDRPPRKKQNAWQFYSAVREHIEYVHIKDGIYIRERPNHRFPETRYTFPGDGDGEVRQVLADLVATGYDGGISIEPHMSVVIHDEASDQAVEEKRFNNYIEYGKKLMAIMQEIFEG